jgi:hypothetical protein
MICFRNITALVAGALASVAILGAPASAKADFAVEIITLSNPGGTIIHDGGAGDLDGIKNNQIIFSYTDASYNIVGSLAFTNNPGNADLATLDIDYAMSTISTTGGTNGTGGAAQLLVSATDFTAPNGNPLTLTSQINGNGTGPSGTLTAQQFANNDDLLFSTSGSTPGPQGPFDTSAASGYGSAASTQFTKTGNYSVTEQMDFNLPTNSHTTGDFSSDLTPAPAPAGLLLALTGMPVLGVGAWFRRRKTA